MVEFLAVIAIILVFSLLGYPAIKGVVDRGRLVGTVQSVSALLGQARQESIKLQVPVVAKADYDSREVVIFANVDRDPGFAYTYDGASSQRRRADFEISRVQVPVDYDIDFWGPGDKAPRGADAIDGLTTTANGQVAVFLPDGSVRDPGAFRFADENGRNFLEVRIGIAATGRTLVQKYHEDPPWGGKAGFFPGGRHEGTNSPMWQWY